MTMTSVIGTMGLVLMLGAGCGSDDSESGIDPAFLETCGDQSISTNNDDCVFDWMNCEDGGSYSLDCTTDSAGLSSCSCLSNGTPAGTFLADDACSLDFAELADLIAVECDS